MKIRYMSDLHNEFYRYEEQHGRSMHDKYPIQPMEDDAETTLILAGDIDVSKFVKYSLEAYSRQFKHVIYVAGNHDYWRENLERHIPKLKEMLEYFDVDNVHILDKSSITLDGVTFVGGTLWTDFGKQNPLAMMDAPRIMADYRKIRVGPQYKKLRPIHLLSEHIACKQAIREVAEQNPEKLVVVTHHAPSYMSMDPMYSHSTISNMFYYSELTELLEYDSITHWIHGHTHCAQDYELYGCRVMCNPLGYIGEGETNFVPTASFQI
jgi:predicted phosphodiesterase